MGICLTTKLFCGCFFPRHLATTQKFFKVETLKKYHLRPEKRVRVINMQGRWEKTNQICIAEWFLSLSNFYLQSRAHTFAIVPPVSPWRVCQNPPKENGSIQLETQWATLEQHGKHTHHSVGANLWLMPLIFMVFGSGKRKKLRWGGGNKEERGKENPPSQSSYWSSRKGVWMAGKIVRRFLPEVKL